MAHLCGRILVYGRHQDVRGIFAIVHEGLHAIQVELAIHGAHRRLHVLRVGTGLRLGNRQGEHHATSAAEVVDDGRKVVVARKARHNMQFEQVVLERKRAAGAAAELLNRHRLGKQALGKRARTARRRRQGKVAACELLHHIVGQSLILAPLADIIDGENLRTVFAHALDHVALLLGQIEIHGTLRLNLFPLSAYTIPYLLAFLRHSIRFKWASSS